MRGRFVSRCQRGKGRDRRGERLERLILWPILNAHHISTENQNPLCCRKFKLVETTPLWSPDPIILNPRGQPTQLNIVRFNRGKLCFLTTFFNATKSCVTTRRR